MEITSVWAVFIAASITAIATGLGALPFLFVKDISKRWLGYGNSLAAGLMLGASLGLMVEGATLDNVEQPILRLIIGMVLGLVLVVVAHKFLEQRGDDFSIGNVQGADAISMLLIVGVMTVHSFAEGIGVGVSYGDGNSFGVLISTAIAIQNIPEGLAISLVLIPKGTSVWRAAGWSVFSSVPQPLMAVPAFLFVLAFRPYLPVGLGLAAGAMIWMVFNELIPDALKDISRKAVYTTMISAVIAMLALQFILSA
ncbi:MAG: ZIP family metal transporter [Anaerolineae bacterium]|nr:ZIP family metal transporter [Anaerolineae bacterium]MDQ7036261.1 ZIP family metal transporter [Anaerolineae bacterium]